MEIKRPETDNLEDWKQYADELAEALEEHLVHGCYGWHYQTDKQYKQLRTLYQHQKGKLNDLRKELKKKKYEQYVEADHLDYLTLETMYSYAESTVEQLLQCNNRWIAKFEEIKKYVQDNYGFDIDKIYSYSVMNIETRKDQSKMQSKAGRPSKFDDSKIALVKLLRQKGYSMRDIAKELDVSVGTIHRILHLDEE